MFSSKRKHINYLWYGTISALVEAIVEGAGYITKQDVDLFKADILPYVKGGRLLDLNQTTRSYKYSLQPALVVRKDVYFVLYFLTRPVVLENPL